MKVECAKEQKGPNKCGNLRKHVRCGEVVNVVVVFGACKAAKSQVVVRQTCQAEKAQQFAGPFAVRMCETCAKHVNAAKHP